MHNPIQVCEWVPAKMLEWWHCGGLVCHPVGRSNAFTCFVPWKLTFNAGLTGCQLGSHIYKKSRGFTCLLSRILVFEPFERPSCLLIVQLTCPSAKKNRVLHWDRWEMHLLGDLLQNAMQTASTTECSATLLLATAGVWIHLDVKYQEQGVRDVSVALIKVCICSFLP